MTTSKTADYVFAWCVALVTSAGRLGELDAEAEGRAWEDGWEASLVGPGYYGYRGVNEVLREGRWTYSGPRLA